jgi:hypothetical protein
VSESFSEKLARKAREARLQAITEKGVQIASPREVLRVGTISQVQLPGVPDLPNNRSAADHHQSLIDNYHPGQGFWASLFAGRRTKVAALLADQAEHLLRVQRATDAAEAMQYLRKHNLWTAELQVLLAGETAETGIVKARHVRAQEEIKLNLEVNAASEGFTLETHQADLLEENRLKRTLEEEREQAALSLEVSRQESVIAIEAHEHRERLKLELGMKEYQEKAKAIQEVARVQENARALLERDLDSWFVKVSQLELDEGLMDEALRQNRLRRAQTNIERLEAELDGLGRTAQAHRAPTSGENGGGGISPAEPRREFEDPLGDIDKSNPAPSPGNLS